VVTGLVVDGIAKEIGDGLIVLSDNDALSVTTQRHAAVTISQIT
jgi:hypothetical protein